MGKKTLIVYYSWSNGNTERVAEMVQKATGADIARIETVEPYPEDHEETVEQGRREVDEGFQPDIEELDLDPADYDVIVVGTPTWWYTMAPAVSTFLSEHDWAGKTVVPFMTCGGWPGHVIDDMEAACEGATIEASKEITFDSTGGARLVTPEAELRAWVDEVAQLVLG